MLRKADALKVQVRKEEQARIRLLLDSQGLQTVLNLCNSHVTDNLDTFIEPRFVRDTQEALSKVVNDLWLDNDYLRGRVHKTVTKIAGEAALVDHIQQKVSANVLRWVVRRSRQSQYCTNSLERSVGVAHSPLLSSRRDVRPGFETTLAAVDGPPVVANPSRARAADVV